jgi:hypothetical protein
VLILYARVTFVPVTTSAIRDARATELANMASRETVQVTAYKLGRFFNETRKRCRNEENRLRRAEHEYQGAVYCCGFVTFRVR